MDVKIEETMKIDNIYYHVNDIVTIKYKMYGKEDEVTGRICRINDVEQYVCIDYSTVNYANILNVTFKGIITIKKVEG